MSQYDLRHLGGCKPANPVSRFHESYTPEPNTGCWLWMGTERGSNAYGAIKAEGVRWAAHRFSYHIHIGPIPDGLSVCHRCDTPACVNPNHLFLGTVGENSADKVKKRRQARGHELAARQGNYARRGSSNGNSRLSTEVVIAIYLSDKPGRDIAKEYGVTQTTVWAIKNRKTWTHITEAL